MGVRGKRERGEKEQNPRGQGVLASLRGSKKASMTEAKRTRGRVIGQGSGHVKLCYPLKGAWLPLSE